MTKERQWYKPKPGDTYRILPPLGHYSHLFLPRDRALAWLNCKPECWICNLFAYERALEAWENEGGAVK